MLPCLEDTLRAHIAVQLLAPDRTTPIPSPCSAPAGAPPAAASTSPGTHSINRLLVKHSADDLRVYICPQIESPPFIFQTISAILESNAKGIRSSGIVTLAIVFPVLIGFQNVSLKFTSSWGLYASGENNTGQIFCRPVGR